MARGTLTRYAASAITTRALELEANCDGVKLVVSQIQRGK
jgi:hypothetical protein